jgi:hypothetical protein
MKIEWKVVTFLVFIDIYSARANVIQYRVCFV